MVKYQFNVRLDKETQDLINKYTEYISIKNDFMINPGDVNRAIIKKGIDTLIEKEGGLNHIQQVINKNFEDDIENSLIAPMLDMNEFEKLSEDEKQKIIQTELQTGEKYNEKYYKSKGDK